MQDLRFLPLCRLGSVVGFGMLMVILGAPGCAKDGLDSDSGGDDAADTDGDTSAEGGECMVDFEGGAPGTFVTWTITNGRTVPIYLPGTREGCVLEPWSVYRDGERFFWDQGSYIPTCQLLYDTPMCTYGCSDGPATVIKLAPGASVERVFGLYGWTEAAIPPECWEGSDCDPSTTCYLGRASVEEPLTLEVPVTETCDFTDDCGCEGESCTFEISDMQLPLPDAEIVSFEYEGAVEGVTFVVE